MKSRSFPARLLLFTGRRRAGEAADLEAEE